MASPRSRASRSGLPEASGIAPRASRSGPPEASGIAPLAEPDWYRVPVDRKVLKGLQRRTNRHGLAWFGAYVGLCGLFAGLAVAGFGTAWTVASFLAFATVYCFSEPILHETHHRTPFRTLWLNETVHYIAGLAAFKEPIRDRWLHAAHHTYTMYPAIDPEIDVERPPNFLWLCLDVVRIRFAVIQLGLTLRNAVGSIDRYTARFVPASEVRKVVWSARACVACYLAVVALAAGLGSWWRWSWCSAAGSPERGSTAT